MTDLESKAKEIMALLADMPVETLVQNVGHMKQFQLRVAQVTEILKGIKIDSVV